MLRNFDDSHQQGVLDRMEKLGLPAWKDALRADLFCYLTSDHQTDLLVKAERTLMKYEQLERLVLLQLAIWKAECLMQMPDTEIGYSKAVDWMKSGWKALKVEMRGSNAIGTVLSLVHPFMGPL
jgi:hypothetical protein